MKIDRLEREMLIVRGILIGNVTKKKKMIEEYCVLCATE